MIVSAAPPAGTPRPIVDKLNAALRAGLADDKLRKTFADGGMDEYPPNEETPEASSALLKREIKLWGDVTAPARRGSVDWQN
jgi:tripartite-type tricarboxylate transporter receptor subunit TctC